MATAKRITPPSQRVSVIEKMFAVQETALYKDGALQYRSTVPSSGRNWVAIRDNWVPQPDRIVLELSEEEAKVIIMSLAYSHNSKAQSVSLALADMLYPAKGTVASPAKDTGGGAALIDHKTGYKESSSDYR